MLLCTLSRRKLSSVVALDITDFELPPMSEFSSSPCSVKTYLRH